MVAAALALLVVPVLAWLYMQRSMETITKVDMPYSLFIGAGDAKPIQQLELSDIDVSGGAGAKDVVFCVYGTKQEKNIICRWHILRILGLSIPYIRHQWIVQIVQDILVILESTIQEERC